jgi:hypothetical protein
MKRQVTKKEGNEARICLGRGRTDKLSGATFNKGRINPKTPYNTSSRTLVAQCCQFNIYLDP